MQSVIHSGSPSGKIPSNIDYHEGYHCANPGAPHAWAWPAPAPDLLSTMDYTYRECHGEAICRFKNGMLPSSFFRRNVVLSF